VSKSRVATEHQGSGRSAEAGGPLDLHGPLVLHASTGGGRPFGVMIKMKDAWEGPVMRRFYVVMLLLPLAIIIALAIALGEVRMDLATWAAVTGATYIPILFVMFLARRQFMEEWSSNRRFVAIGFREARPRLEAAFASSGLSYEMAARTDPQEDLRYELGRGLGAQLLRSEGEERCVIYVWPVNDRTRRDVGGLKRSIDAAFPPAR